MAKGKSITAIKLSPTPELAAIIGADKVTRPQAVKAAWDYIKYKKLQDKNNKRMINADAKLKLLFGGKKQVSMFALAKIISQNLK